MVDAQIEGMKVYELAKELGIDSISLLDRLKGLNIQVKNHMSELSQGDVAMARTQLGKPTTSAASTSAAKKPATKVVRKKPATDSTATQSATSASSAKQAAAAAAAAAAESVSGEKKASNPIIRRRTKADGTVEGAPTATSAKVAEAAQANAEVHAHDATSADHHEEVHAAAPATTPEVEATIAHEPTIVETVFDEPADEPIVAVAPTAPAAPVVTIATTESGKTKIEATPIISLAPKRTFLKIVQASAPPPRPIIKPAPNNTTGPVGTSTDKRTQGPMRGQTTQDKDGFRVIRMTKENLDQMVEEEAAKKRGGGGGREAEIRPEDVRFADYRKKEMVFLPKKKKLPMGKEIRRTAITTPSAKKRVVEMGEHITVSDLANQMNLKTTDVIKKLMMMGSMVTMNQAIDFDMASLVAAEFQFEVKNISFKEDVFIDHTEDTAEQLISRPAVVTIMGHVDHGKTSLLDAIRDANVAKGEAGGITQHIGAYTVEKDGKLITFIDTPGHEAFTTMRARGADVTDIVVLVVAADDGVMPQTREALSHAQAAGVPIIVAVNKIDKPSANPEKIKQALAELNLLSEDWGGQTMFVPVSAIKRTNLDKLLEAINLQAEVLDLKANVNARASGTVLEARLEKGRGPVVSVLVNRGTLRIGDSVLAGLFSGRVRAMMDDKGKQQKETTPGIAVEILGFEGLPNAGDRFDSPESENDAHKIVENRKEIERVKNAGTSARTRLEDLFSSATQGNVKELNLILKSDVFGSCEAIKESLLKLSTEKVKVKVILASPGGITESDVLLATASHAIIIGFNVRPETKARQTAEAEHVEIKCYSIIYELIDDIRKSMTGLLDKKKVETFLGRAEIRQTFTVPKIGTIGGSSVIDGKIVRGANVRLLRDSRIIYEGKMTSLRRFKDDAKEVAQGYECGIGLENYNDLKPGDVVEAYQIDFITPELS